MRRLDVTLSSLRRHVPVGILVKLDIRLCTLSLITAGRTEGGDVDRFFSDADNPRWFSCCVNTGHDRGWRL